MLKSGDIAKIVWLDIFTNLRVPKKEVEEVKDFKTLMCQTTSYGRIYKIQNGIILLIHEESIELDYTMIPVSLVKDYKIYERANKINK